MGNVHEKHLSFVEYSLSGKHPNPEGLYLNKK